MKSLTLAFLLVMAAAAVCFLTLSMLGVSSEGAGSISSVFFGGISYVHQVLGTRGGRASVSALPQSVVSFERFHLPWCTMIVYGGLVYAAALQAGSGIGGLLAAVSGIGLDAILPTLATVGFMVGAVSAWFVGAWIGRRCAGWGILATLVAASLGRALASVVDFTFIPAGEFMLIFGEPKSLEFFATQVAAGSLLFWPFALLGYWRGRCTKDLRYSLS